MQILLIEDEDVQADMWAYLLLRIVKNPYISRFKSVEEFEAAFADVSLALQSYDLVISDIYLNGSKTGLDFCRSYMASSDYKKYPPFILTSSMSLDDIIKGLGSQDYVIWGVPYIQKPIDPTELNPLIEEIFRSHQRNMFDVTTA